jgi:hypothetical protein
MHPVLQLHIVLKSINVDILKNIWKIGNIKVFAWQTTTAMLQSYN